MEPTTSHRGRRRAVCPLLFALALCLQTGCVSPTSSLQLRETGRALARPQMLDQPFAGDRLSLSAAMGETVGQLIQLSANRAVTKPTVVASPLEGPSGAIDASNVRLYRAERVSIDRWPGWHIRALTPSLRVDEPFDVLVPIEAPIGGLSTQVPANTGLVLWVDVSVPPATPPGRYTGRVELRSGRSPVQALMLDLTVLPFSIAPPDGVTMIGELDLDSLFDHHMKGAIGRNTSTPADKLLEPNSDGRLYVMRATLALLSDHGVTPTVASFTPPSRPGDRGRLTPDWRSFDQLLAPYYDGKLVNGYAPRLIALPAGIRGPLDRSPSENQPDPRRDRTSFTKDAIDHFTTKGWIDRAYQFVADANTLADLIQPLSKKPRIVTGAFPQDLAPLGWTGFVPRPIGASIDTLMPPAQFFDPREMADQRSRQRRSWFSVDRPPFSGTLDVRAPGSCARILAWQGHSLHADVVFLGTINDWPEPSRNLSAADITVHNPTALLYPGTRFGLTAPVPSLRLKRIRQGMNDVAYLELLRAQRLDHVADAVLESVSRYAGSDAYHTSYTDGRSLGWPLDLAAFDLAREAMSGQLQLAGTAPNAVEEGTGLPSHDAAWRRLMLDTREVTAEVIGHRIRRVQRANHEAFTLATSVTIDNPSRGAVSAVLRVPDVHAHWTWSDSVASAINLPRASRRQLTVGANLSARPSWNLGHLEYGVVLESAEGAAQTAAALASCITAALAPPSIRIDGDLSDWPAGADNVAGDFRLIAPAHDDELQARTPRHDTLVFTLLSRDSLFVAVNCSARSTLASDRARRTGQRYEDMIPVGDELIEILIDPLNSGTRSPGDLFYMLVKRSGAGVASQGVQLIPPCGRYEPWSAEADVATADQIGRWTAEIRIPLKAFGNVETARTVWGFNVTRFDLANQEYSTWSGAVRNAYDPLSLGNLIFP